MMMITYDMMIMISEFYDAPGDSFAHGSDGGFDLTMPPSECFGRTESSASLSGRKATTGFPSHQGREIEFPWMDPGQTEDER